MALDVTKPLKVQDLGATTTKLTAKIALAFKAAKTENGTVSFFTDSDTTGTPAFSFNFPEEIYLRQLGTQIVPNFTFDSATYKGAANPNLDGKTVLTLAVRGDSDTVTFCFADMSKLVDVYTPKDNSVAVDNYKIKVNIDADSDNILTLTNNGLFVDGSAIETTPYTNSDTSVTVDNYKIKVNIDADSDNILTLTNNGLFVDGSAIETTPYTNSDSSVAISDYKVKVNLDASSDNILALTENGLMVDGSNLGGGSAKVEGATAGNLAVFDSDGGIVDSGFSVATDAEVEAYLNRIFPNT